MTEDRDINARVLYLEQSVSSVRETIAQLSADQKHLTRTLDRVDSRTETMCSRLESMPIAANLLKDPRAIFLLFALFGGAVGADTVAASLINSASATAEAP
tara:strand:+ start:262 stop:564 length:303 start_codon:yes stop_codon:yes gene_type:complete